MSAHAVKRAIERQPGVYSRAAAMSAMSAMSAIDTNSVRCPCKFGAPYFRLSSGHRIVIEVGVVTTMLPAGDHVWRLSIQAYRKRCHARGWAQYKKLSAH